MSLRVTALAGGIGGAKLLVGLGAVLPAANLTAIVNTGDDATIYGVHVSPDVDIVTYWLAGVADTERGWGLRGDTFHLIESLERLGVGTWFRLGDRDFATCLYRTQRLREGATLSTVADEIRRAFGVTQTLLPMSDEPAPTLLRTSDWRLLEFQDYFVREKTKPEVVAVHLPGDAKPGPGILDAIVNADVVVLCPSNPFVSIGPILALPGVRAELRSHTNVIAVSPIIRGRALKGPADRLMRSLSGESSAAAVASLYADFCDVFVVDDSDRDEVSRIQDERVTARSLPTIMTSHKDSARLAEGLLS